MEHYFGVISLTPVETGRAPSLHKTTEPTMHLNEIGRYADEQLRNVSSHYPYAEIPLWVVMPNHIHAIVIIDGDKTPNEQRGYGIVGTGCETIVETGRETIVETGRAPSLRERMKQTDNCKGWLSIVVGGIKSSITKFANSHALSFAWQTRFHDHIIRDRNEMNRIAHYIENNVVQWESDSLYTLTESHSLNK